MFDLLKKKISSFINAVSDKAVGKTQFVAEPSQALAVVGEPLAVHVAEPLVTAVPNPRPEVAALAIDELAPRAHGEPSAVVTQTQPVSPVESRQVHVTHIAHREIHSEEKHAGIKQVSSPVVGEPKVAEVAPVQLAEVERKLLPASSSQPTTAVDFKPKLGLLSRVKSVFSPEIEISQAEVAPVLEGLELAMLESDVSFDATQQIVSSLKQRLTGKKVKSGRAGDEIRDEVRGAMLSLFEAKPFDVYNFLYALKQKKEVAVILFVGPNGSGKTTTIAKLAKQLSARGFSCVIAAGDTFRKAAIEQAKFHGEKLDVRVVSHQYGSDPSAVAFDAVAHAKAESKDVVLVDTAGRQETNVNLVREMEKMERVLKPSLKIFVGEAIAGNALAEQAKQFHKAIKLDGIILTKLDCDAKGGGAFSIAHDTGLPILMIGTGQEYADLMPFDAEWLVDSVIAG